MYNFYKTLTANSSIALEFLLSQRLKKGKEHPVRVQEKKGLSSKIRPMGFLIWVHAASVGEAQSTLILVNKLLSDYPDIHVLVTTGTLNSSILMEQKLSARCLHQFYPLDHPQWTERFLNHWRPDLILWMESELWPNMLAQVKSRNIPALLVNARLSRRSYKRWKLFKPLVASMLGSFSKILCQTDTDAEHFTSLGATSTQVTGNLKFSASPLNFQKSDLQTLSAITTGRPLWLFASTHKGEEEMACRIHEILKNALPDLLTIIVPRHPERRDHIADSCKSYKLNMVFRGQNKMIPKPDTDIYIVDTMGELGLFYRLATVTCIGRSFSDDGGGGHNPIEPAQLGCVVLHGPNVQNLQEIYDLMDLEGAALRIESEGHLENTLHALLTNLEVREAHQNKALAFTRVRVGVVDIVMQEIESLIPEKKNLSSKASHAP